MINVLTRNGFRSGEYKLKLVYCIKKEEKAKLKYIHTSFLDQTVLS